MLSLACLFTSIRVCTRKNEKKRMMCLCVVVVASSSPRVSLAPLVLGEQLSTSYSIIVVLSTSVDDVKENSQLSSESSICFGIRRLDSEWIVSNEAF